jgi:hypothetical protein
LQKWLAKQNKFLQAPCPQNNIGDNVEEDSAYTWLGLNLLIELKTLLSLSIPVPFGFLEMAAASLSAEEQTEVGFLVENVMAELKLAVRGIVSDK